MRLYTEEYIEYNIYRHQSSW